MADLDRIGPLKPTIPPATRREHGRKRDRDDAPEPGREDKAVDKPKPEGPHQVDDYA